MTITFLTCACLQTSIARIVGLPNDEDLCDMKVKFSEKDVTRAFEKGGMVDGWASLKRINPPEGLIDLMREVRCFVQATSCVD